MSDYFCNIYNFHNFALSRRPVKATDDTAIITIAII